MTNWPAHARLANCVLVIGVLALAAIRTERPTAAQEPKANAPADDYATATRPLVKKYCLDCHSTKAKKGSLDLERFATSADIRRDLKPWQAIIEQLEAGEMPPKEKPQPTAEERKKLLAWVRDFLDAEAKARSGDPGHVPLRRLSNAEYNSTIRDLTGVDLRPAREFPADGAAGEGFTNAAEALTDISPALFTKYLNAAKDIADHAVLLPDGFRFSHSKTRRDWTDEGTAALRKFYAAHVGGDGKLPVQPYLRATVRHRDALAAGKFAEVAAKEKLNAKYLGVLWQALTDKTPSHPLDAIRARWRAAVEKDVPALAAEVAAWQSALWKTVKVGNYIQASWTSPGGYVESLTRQVPVDPPAAESVPLRLAVKPAPGQSELVLYLSAREAASGTAGDVVWQRPRFEGAGKPTLLLSEYGAFGAAFEVDYPSAFADSAKYLAAVVELANDRKLTPEAAAKARGLDAAFLKRWSEVLAVEPFARDAESIGRVVPAVELTLLEEKTPRNDARPAINGWKKKGTDLPVLVTNSSDKAEQIPGRVPAKGVGVHPMPKEFVAVVWIAPVATSVKVVTKVVHAHPACGNGVAWWLEHRRGGRAAVFGEGAVDLGGEATPDAKTLKVEKGDQVILAVDAKNNDHVCDMTAIEFTLTETDKTRRVWNLAADIAASVHDGNPHADNHGHKAVWSFVRGPSRALGKSISNVIPAESLLGKWREAASDPKRKDESAKLAGQVQSLLSGKRPAQEKSPDRVLYDNLVSVESTLFAGVDVAKFAKPQAASSFGLSKEKFADANLVAKANEVIEVKLPAALFAGRELVVDAKLGGPAGDRLVRVAVSTTKLAPGVRWDGPLVGSATSDAYKRVVAGNAEFRKVFPLFVCFPQVVPTDEVVTLKMFHREDEPLVRLFLDDEQTRTLDRLWSEQRFVSRQPVAEYDYLPQFMGYTTQDTPKAFQQFFIDRKTLFKKHADEFLKDEEAAIPKQLDALLAFAEKAYRRPLQEKENADLRALYGAIRKNGAAHDEAFRGVLARILVAPAFLFRIEGAPKGKEPAPVNDWELATRLSYFLWSSMPDDELRTLAAAGKLRDPMVLAAQAQRMLKDARTRSLAIEFGTQWIHVRGFDEFNEKNEKLFPTFTPELRKAMYEESILFFLDLFQGDRAVTSILDADHTFLDETLAKHYGIPGVTGPQWRKVAGVRKYGRGGILGFASVQSKQAGASRTSPVLRGNWVVETLLGEKLPKPPPDVPQLPEMEGADKLTTRQLVEKHVSVQSCAVCHVRIDPFGFALEKYDPIGRVREKEVSGLPIDAKSKLKDGAEFEGIDGLRNYLLTKKKDVVVRLFCRRLLGYALGRAVTLSDTALIDEMVSALNKSEGRVSAAVQTIVKSPQFRMVRGSDFAPE
jgi:mono/diheme cytochrome c family protein